MLSKKQAPHPGEVLKEIYLEDMGITQSELARRIGCAVQKVNEVVNGKRGVTAHFALDLAEALGTSAKMWLNLQQNYDLWNAIKKRDRAS